MKEPLKSRYKSPKSVAKNQTVPISADDPRVGWDKAGQTKARQGAEIEIIGLDGVPLVEGGRLLVSNSGSNSANNLREEEKFVLPGTNNQPPTITRNFGITVLADITNLSTAWSGDGSGPNLVVTFDWDYQDPANQGVTEFVLEITESSGYTRQTPYGSFPVNRTQTAQTITVVESLMNVTMGTLTKDIFSVCVYVIDAFYNKSTSVCDITVPVHDFSAPTPVITVSPAANGYSVLYTIPSSHQDQIGAIEIVEYESNADTEPIENAVDGIIYSRVYFDDISPAKILTINTNSRWVKARYAARWGAYNSYSAAQKVTPIDPITVDTVGPGNVATVTTSGGIDPTDYLGFNGYADIGWSEVTGGDIRGYRIRFKPTGSSVYSYADSPGVALSYRLTGLAVGVTYNIEVATYDQYNNTSTSYVAGSNVSIPGTPIMNGFITAGEFRFGDGVVTGKRGLLFNDSNYWYINSSSTAEFKLGGPTSNYISWDGAELKVNGNLGVDGSTKIGGNIQLTTSGASIYNGTINLNGNLTGNGFALNSDGLKVANGSNSVTLDAATGSITANAGNIAGWTIDVNKISKTRSVLGVPQGTISLNSLEGYISVESDNAPGRTAGINSAASTTDLAFWAGGTGTLSPSSNSFRVNLNGGLFASEAEVQGTIRARDGGFGTFDTNGEVVDGWTINTNEIIATGAGRLKVGDYSVESNDGLDFVIFDEGSQTVILKTDSVPNGTTDNKRIFLGDNTRQVEVEKSAGVWPEGSIVAESAGTFTDKQQYRSGGLRNMFTVTKLNLHDETNGEVNDFPSADKGDILVVYDAQFPGIWKKADIYLKSSGSDTYYYATYTERGTVCDEEPAYVETVTAIPAEVSPNTVFNVLVIGDTRIRGYYSTISIPDALEKLCADTSYCCGKGSAPVISTTSSLTIGSTGASIVVTSTGFKPTASINDFTASVGTTGLTLSSITNTSTISKTLVFTGTVTAGALQITAKASAFNPVASSASNTLSLSTTGAPAITSLTATAPTTTSQQFVNVTVNWASTNQVSYFLDVTQTGVASFQDTGTTATSSANSDSGSTFRVFSGTPATISLTVYSGPNSTGTSATQSISYTPPVSTTPTPAPTTTAAPATFGITGTPTSTSNTITFSWANPPANTAFYGVYYKVVGGSTSSVFTTTATSYTFTGLTTNTDYIVTVEARNSSNQTLATSVSPASTATSTTATPTTATPTTAAPEVWYCSTSSNISGQSRDTFDADYTASYCDIGATVCSTSEYPAYPSIPACPTTTTTTTTTETPAICGTPPPTEACTLYGVRSIIGTCAISIFGACSVEITYWEPDCTFGFASRLCS